MSEAGLRCRGVVWSMSYKIKTFGIGISRISDPFEHLGRGCKGVSGAIEVAIMSPLVKGDLIVVLNRDERFANPVKDLIQTPAQRRRLPVH